MAHYITFPCEVCLDQIDFTAKEWHERGGIAITILCSDCYHIKDENPRMFKILERLSKNLQYKIQEKIDDLRWDLE